MSERGITYKYSTAFKQKVILEIESGNLGKGVRSRIPAAIDRIQESISLAIVLEGLGNFLLEFGHRSYKNVFVNILMAFRRAPDRSAGRRRSIYLNPEIRRRPLAFGFWLLIFENLRCEYPFTC